MKKVKKDIERNRAAELLKKDNKKNLKPLPNKPIPLGGGPFVGRHTTG
jgi:hypothetical protein